MNTLVWYLAGTLLRGALVAAVLLGWERLSGRRLRSGWGIGLLLALLVLPVGMMTFRSMRPGMETEELGVFEVPVPSTAFSRPEPVAVVKDVETIPRKTVSGWDMSLPGSPLDWAGAAYLGILAALLAVRICRSRKWNRALRSCPEVTDARLNELFAEARRRMGMENRPIRLLDGSDLVWSPGCCSGGGGMVVLFPVAEAVDRSDSEVRMLLTHELEHLRRGDHRTARLFYFISSCYFFNPFYRFLVRRLEGQREIACDAAVVRRLELSEGERLAYAGLLLRYHGFLVRVPVPGLSGNGRELKQRILEVKMNRSRHRFSFSACCCLVLAVAAALLTPACVAKTPAGSAAPEVASADVPPEVASAYVPPEVESGEWKSYNQNTRQMVKKGEFAEALNRYRWAFEHILEYVPSYSSVRVSFLLSYWKELADQYPPALAEMIRTRDEKTAYLDGGKDRRRIPVSYADDSGDGSKRQLIVKEKDWAAFQKSIAGDVGVFQDVVSLNHYLKEEDKTLELFRRLDRDQPEFAKACIRRVAELLIRKREFALTKKYLDIASYWKSFKEQAERNSAEERMGTYLRDKADSLSLLARETGDPKLADRIQAEYQAMAPSLKF